MDGCSSACAGGGVPPSLPPELRGLTGLRALILFNSQLAGSVPREYSELTALDTLDVSLNALTGEGRGTGRMAGRM